MTIQEALQRSERHGVPDLDAHVLLAHALRESISFVDTYPQKNIPQDALRSFEATLRRRAAGTPVAYMTGEKEFYGLSFSVNETTLIPRPESELLVERALVSLRDKRSARILDVGTGCGNCIVSVAVACKDKEHFTYDALDISRDALEIARHNARRHSARVHFFASDLFDHMPRRRYDLIMANLPYLSTGQLREPSLKAEPIGALWGGEGGLDLYKHFLNNVGSFLKEGSEILMEIDPSQKHTLTAEAEAALPETTVTVYDDLAHLPRVLAIRRRTPNTSRHQGSE
ncbi:MAG: peptide chain release factor N(5)-glutamine methyltransferase [Patescibacteria group bacterium]